MPQQIEDPVLIFFEAGALLLSVVTGLYFLVAQFGRPLLHYAPRRPVPWKAFAGVLVLFSLVNSLSSALVLHTSTQQESESAVTNDAGQEGKANSTSTAMELIGSIVLQLLIVGSVLFVVAVVWNATPRDLGLPASPIEFVHDVFVGIMAVLVALAPVHTIQALLAYWMNMGGKSGHPLVKTLTDGEPDMLVMVLASVAAVVVAPICEEIAFRLLFQGWLEKWEDKELGWRSTSSSDVDTDGGIPKPVAEQIVRDELLRIDLEVVGETNSSLGAEQPIDPPPPSNPPRIGIAGLPYGWLPILVSSVLFGIAHLGYGPEPVPLFFLGLVLGYVYQRTHRIVPCIVAHAVFNLFTMVVLWRMLFYGAH